MADEEITVKKIGYYMPVNVLGADEHGRTLVQCPSRGCGDTAYVAEDGRIVCPTDEAITACLSDAVAALESAYVPPWLTRPADTG